MPASSKTEILRFMDILLSNIFTYIIADNPLVVNCYIFYLQKNTAGCGGDLGKH